MDQVVLAGVLAGAVALVGVLVLAQVVPAVGVGVAALAAVAVRAVRGNQLFSFYGLLYKPR